MPAAVSGRSVTRWEWAWGNSALGDSACDDMTCPAMSEGVGDSAGSGTLATTRPAEFSVCLGDTDDCLGLAGEPVGGKEDAAVATSSAPSDLIARKGLLAER